MYDLSFGKNGGNGDLLTTKLECQVSEYNDMRRNFGMSGHATVKWDQRPSDVMQPTHFFKRKRRGRKKSTLHIILRKKVNLITVVIFLCSGKDGLPGRPPKVSYLILDLGISPMQTFFKGVHPHFSSHYVTVAPPPLIYGRE